MTTGYTKFDDSMKDSYTILVPYMLPIHFRLITPVFKKSGYTIVPLDNVGDGVREQGLSHVHNDTCYPALLVPFHVPSCCAGFVFRFSHFCTPALYPDH